MLDLIYYLNKTEGLHRRQFGFRSGKSTLDAIDCIKQAVSKAREGAWQHKKLCLLDTLDVQNAFNTARRECIMKALRQKKVPIYLKKIISSYLKERRLVVVNAKREVTCGVPQGSVMSPTL